MGVLSNEACRIRTFLVETANHRLLMSVLRQEHGHCMIAFENPTFHPTYQTDTTGQWLQTISDESDTTGPVRPFAPTS
jgi:hypothetical protein